MTNLTNHTALRESEQLISPSTSSTDTSKQKSVGSMDAIAILKADHQAIHEMFGEYENRIGKSQKKALLTDICTALSIHVQIEEELFYPAVESALKNPLLVSEASVEHEGIKRLMIEIEALEPDDDMFDAKVKVLSEYVKHHVKEEHDEMFPQAREAGIEMKELGERMASRKIKLLAARISKNAKAP